MADRVIVENPTGLKIGLVVGIAGFLGGGVAGVLFAALGDLATAERVGSAAAGAFFEYLARNAGALLQRLARQ